jgi:hypothetical protein
MTTEEQVMRYPAAGRQIALARVASAVAAIAFGAGAVGVLAVGRLAIGWVAMNCGSIARLTVDDLEVRRFHIGEMIVDDKTRRGGASSPVAQPARHERTGAER